LQPVYVGDVAAIAVSSARETESHIVDAIGPEAYTFKDFVALLAAQIKPSARLVHVPPAIGIALGQLIGLAVGDIVLTTDELQGLREGLLTSTQAPNGATRFSQWLELNKAQVGTAYHSELGRHFRWRQAA
jgi:NADH dehydrogenase